MDRLGFFKKCGKYLAGAAASVTALTTVGSQSHGIDLVKIDSMSDTLKPIEVDDRCYEENGITRVDDIPKGIEVEVINGNTVRIYGVPQKSSVAVELFDSDKGTIIEFKT